MRASGTDLNSELVHVYTSQLPLSGSRFDSLAPLAGVEQDNGLRAVPNAMQFTHK